LPKKIGKAPQLGKREGCPRKRKVGKKKTRRKKHGGSNLLKNRLGRRNVKKKNDGRGLTKRKSGRGKRSGWEGLTERGFFHFKDAVS